MQNNRTAEDIEDGIRKAFERAAMPELPPEIEEAVHTLAHALVVASRIPEIRTDGLIDEKSQHRQIAEQPQNVNSAFEK